MLMKNLYERIRVNGKFEQVFNNIRRFNELRRDKYPFKIVTRVSGVKFDPEQNIERFIDFWSSILMKWE